MQKLMKFLSTFRCVFLAVVPFILVVIFNAWIYIDIRKRSDAREKSNNLNFKRSASNLLASTPATAR